MDENTTITLYLQIHEYIHDLHECMETICTKRKLLQNFSYQEV